MVTEQSSVTDRFEASSGSISLISSAGNDRIPSKDAEFVDERIEVRV